MDNVEVIGFNTLTVDFAREVGASVILKGIRTVTDFEYEFQMLNMNRALSPGLETVFWPHPRSTLHLLDARAPNRRIRRGCQPIRATSGSGCHQGGRGWLTLAPLAKDRCSTANP